MRNLLLAAAPLALLLTAAPAQPQASAAIAAGKAHPSPLAPSEIVAAAPKGDWTAIPKTDLLVMELAPDAKGKPRRVVIQLMPPPFSQGWIGNIRKLAAAHWWDGMSVNRVQDNYVVQWGDPNADDKDKAKALPVGLRTMAESEYTIKIDHDRYSQLPNGQIDFVHAQFSEAGWWNPADDSFARWTGIVSGWPVASEGSKRWPVHCYGMVGVGRDLSPNTGSGAELYVVIGHAPRHLDRNIALVGRVIEGMEFLSSLPRGHGALGFVDPAQGDERVPIISIHPGAEVADLPAYEYLAGRTFAKYADARANRRDAFFIKPAGGADICNIPVPVRRVAPTK